MDVLISLNVVIISLYMYIKNMLYTFNIHYFY